MEIKDLKNKWKENIDKEINVYSKKELESVILKNARKSIGRAYPQMLLVFISLCTLLSIWMAIRNISSTSLFVFWISCIFLFFAFIGVYIWSRRKMQKYSFDMPLKDWIGARIDDLDRSIRLKKKYPIRAIAYGVGFTVQIIIYVLLITTMGFTLQRVLIPFAIGTAGIIIITEIERYQSMKRLINAREQLAELSEQLKN